MTNTSGTEPHDHETLHEGEVPHDHDFVHESPSEHEFDDDEHGATAEDEHIEESALTGEDESETRRRSPVLPLLAAVGGVLLLGAAAWWQFGSGIGSAPLPVAAGTPPAITPLSATPPQQQAVAAKRGASSATPSASSVGVAPKTAASPIQETVPEASVAAPSSSPILEAVAASASAPAATPAASMTSEPAVPTSVASTATSAAPAVVAGDKNDHRVDALIARIDELQKQLNQANQQLGQVTNMVAASVNTASAAPVSKDMQDRLDKMEQQIAALNPRPAAAPTSHVTGIVLGAPKPVAPAVKPYHPTPNKTKIAQAHRPVGKKAGKRFESPPVWVLRAAVPGQAWVASNATSRDLRPVKVGDMLQGIGRVTAIQQQEGGWIVRGVQGVIR